MLTVYGALMPLRLLEEIRFWKMQEKEHTVVIRELAPNLEPEYVKLLKEWEPVFARTEHTAEQWIEAVLRSPGGITPYMKQQIEELLRASVLQSNSFISQLCYMMSNSKAVNANPTAQVVIQHIIRESEYFLGVLQVLTAQNPAAPPNPGDQFHIHGIRSITVQEPRPDSIQAPAQSEELPTALAQRYKPVPVGGHTLPPLPYAYDALEPYIDKETMRLHHDKHHQSYVDGLNTAEKKLEEARKSGDFALIKHWERELAFHGAGHYLHTIFWSIMAPKAGGNPVGLSADQIKKDFGSFDAFKKQFSQAAEKVEGGGWAIWAWSPRSHRTEILTAEKHQNLSQWDVIPLLALDVWEHAYYLKYQNKRPDYIEAWWNLVNWKHVNERLVAARQLMWQPY